MYIIYMFSIDANDDHYHPNVLTVSIDTIYLTADANSCTRCGQIPTHTKANCPARGAVCHKCKKKGHFRVCCRSKASVNQLSADTPKEGDAFLGTIDTVTDSTKSWTTDILLNGQMLQL